MASIESQQRQEQEQSTSTSTTTSPSSCPYAKALQLPTSGSVYSLPGLVKLNQCPAFSKNGGCPFKGLKSPEEVTERLQQIPPSHLDQSGTFYKTLEYFHQQSQSSSSPATAAGSCPVKHALPQNWSFDQAMEEYSLAADMGRLAQEWEDKEDDVVDVDAAASKSTQESSAVLQQEEEEEAITTPPPLVPRLSDALKSGTAAAHQAAESVHFVKNFIRGKIDRDLYGLLVGQLYHLYRRLEQALDDHAPGQFQSAHFPKELHRCEALQEDVDFWHSTSSPSISPATQEYMDRIDHLCETNPLLLLAHAYTRYMGDLSGGKVLARVARRALQLQDDGLAFYEFPHVESFKLFKDRYRSCLNDLPLSPTQIQALVQEANVAFLLNMRLFEELDVLGGVPGATIRPLQEVYAAKAIPTTSTSTSSASSNDNAESEKCPFLINKKEKENSNVNTTTTPTKTTGTCPWPFLLLHDPKKGVQAWQTWLIIGLLLVYVFHQFHTTTYAAAVIPEPIPEMTRTTPQSIKTFFTYTQLYDQWQHRA
jgi:heme oxygenase